MPPDRPAPRRSPSRELGRRIPLATFAAALVLSWGTTDSFLHGGASLDSVLAHLALASALTFAALRILAAVVGRYERSRPPEQT
jgi:hypothetical protein